MCATPPRSAPSSSPRSRTRAGRTGASTWPSPNDRIAMALLDDVITYLEMFARPPARPLPIPPQKHAVMQAAPCTVSFYRYLYNTVGEPWLWFERRVVGDAALAALLARATIEVFVLYVGGVPAGFFEL